MRRRILAALAILMGEPVPHEWAVCPNNTNDTTTYELNDKYIAYFPSFWTGITDVGADTKGFRPPRDYMT